MVWHLFLDRVLSKALQLQYSKRVQKMMDFVGLAIVWDRGFSKPIQLHCYKRVQKVMVFGGLAVVLESEFQQSYIITLLQTYSKTDGFCWSGTCVGFGF